MATIWLRFLGEGGLRQKATILGYDFFVSFSKVNFTVVSSKKSGYDMATIFLVVGGSGAFGYDMATILWGRGVYGLFWLRSFWTAS